MNTYKTNDIAGKVALVVFLAGMSVCLILGITLILGARTYIPDISDLKEVKAEEVRFSSDNDVIESVYDEIPPIPATKVEEVTEDTEISPDQPIVDQTISGSDTSKIRQSASINDTGSFKFTISRLYMSEDGEDTDLLIPEITSDYIHHSELAEIELWPGYAGEDLFTAARDAHKLLSVDFYTDGYTQPLIAAVDYGTSEDDKPLPRYTAEEVRYDTERGVYTAHVLFGIRKIVILSGTDALDEYASDTNASYALYTQEEILAVCGGSTDIMPGRFDDIPDTGTAGEDPGGDAVTYTKVTLKPGRYIITPETDKITLKQHGEAEEYAKADGSFGYLVDHPGELTVGGIMSWEREG